MVDIDKAIAFVRARGNKLDQLRLRRALGESFTLAEAEEVLAPYQFSDGSWDYDSPDEKPSRLGSFGGTIQCLRWIREFGLFNSPEMARTLDFLSSIQSPDGSFYETEAKLAHSPQAWLQKNTLIDRFYFTAAVPMRLFSLGYRLQPMIPPALKWLTGYWADWTLVTGTWYNLWALLCIYPAQVGFSEGLYRRCYAKALDWLPDLSPQPLTWLLDSLHGAGYSSDEPLVVKGMERLLDLQKDGIWPDPHASVETTITALKLLRGYDVGL